MSEADVMRVVREAVENSYAIRMCNCSLDETGSLEGGEHTPYCPVMKYRAKEAEALEALDSLTTRLAAETDRANAHSDAVGALATRLHDEQIAHGYTKSEALAHFTRQKEAEALRDKWMEKAVDQAAQVLALREQLTQAREALERIARVPLEEDDYVPDGTMQNIASEALATMGEGETARERAIREAGRPGYNPFMTARVEDGRDEPATINREGETEA